MRDHLEDQDTDKEYWEGNIKMNLRYTEWEGKEWIHATHIGTIHVLLWTQ
jgi:hypothetical protein